MQAQVPNGFDFRLRALEESMREVRAELKSLNTAVLSERVGRLSEDVKDLRLEMKNTRRAYIGVGGTLIAGLVILILTLATG